MAITWKKIAFETDCILKSSFTADDKILVGTGAGTFEELSCTPFAQSILDDANEATFKATVNLESGVDFPSYGQVLARAFLR